MKWYCGYGYGSASCWFFCWFVKPLFDEKKALSLVETAAVVSNMSLCVSVCFTLNVRF